MTEIKHDILIKADSETIYQALSTPQGLESWFTSNVKGSGQVGTEWELTFTDQPSFLWKILKSESPHRVAWKCLKGPGKSPGTEVEFVLKTSSENEDRTTLTIIHSGWRKDDPKYDRCVEIWRKLMTHLQRYCEENIAEPAYQ
jgi:uncharacterized protein YndB with AHSA1/START domain